MEPKTDECFSRYYRLFNEILDTLMSNIKLIFDSQSGIKFESFKYRQLSYISQKVFQNLKNYASYFDMFHLRNELSRV